MKDTIGNEKRITLKLLKMGPETKSSSSEKAHSNKIVVRQNELLKEKKR